MEKKTFTKKLGKHIVKLREEKEITQVELAKLCKKPKQNINRLEAGNINPTAYLLYEISEALDIPLTDMLAF